VAKKDKGADREEDYVGRFGEANFQGFMVESILHGVNVLCKYKSYIVFTSYEVQG
jgi:hypothetical protein